MPGSISVPVKACGKSTFAPGRRARFPGRRPRHAFGAALLLLAIALVGCAATIMRLTNPSAPFTLTYPPEFGLLAERVAFGPPRGGCGDEIVNDLTMVFMRNGVEVMDLAVFDTRVAPAAGRAPADTPGGPTLMIDINVTQCDFEQDRRTRTAQRTATVNNEKVTYEVTEFISETTAHLRGSVRVTDLQTGRVRGVRTLGYSPNAERRSDEDYPEFPSGTALVDDAVRRASAHVERLFLPRTRFESLVFFDDETCGLNFAWLTLEAGDRRGALEISLENLERCRHLPDPAAHARAHHNVGVVHAVLRDYQAAIRHFREATRLDPGNGIYPEAAALVVEAETIEDAWRRLRGEPPAGARDR